MKHNWEYKRLGDICTVNFGKRIVAKDTTPGPYKVYGGGGATFTTLNFNRENCTIVSRFAMSSNCVRFVKGKFFLNDSGLTIETKNDFLTQGFIDKFLWVNQPLIYGLGRGMAQKNLNVKALLEINVPVPPMDVQEQIVAELDKINETIEDCRELLRNLDALGQSLFYDYFGDPITNPYNFPKSKLDQLCNIVGRIGFRGYTRNDLVEAGQGAITLSPTNIVNGVVTYDKNTYISWDKYDESPEIMIFDGDVLLTKTGSTVGKIGIVKTLPEKATINPQLVVLKNLKLNNWYITFTLRNDAYQEIIREKSGGSAVPTISQKILGTISLPVPPLELQEKFAERIEQIEAQKKIVESTIAELQTLLDSRMDYWFN